MIHLHRLSTSREPFQLNPDLIERIDASPDCHVPLTTGQRSPCASRVDEVVGAIRDWRVDVLARRPAARAQTRTAPPVGGPVPRSALKRRSRARPTTG